MTTPLDRPLRRAVEIDGEAYVATMLPAGVRLVRKGRRNGVEVTWQQILTGDVVLHAQLAASLKPKANEQAKAGPSRRARSATSQLAKTVDSDGTAPRPQRRRRQSEFASASLRRNR